MESTDKSNQIVHEAELTRQHARYKIPAKIEIDGKIYNVYDWSVSGVGIENLDENIYKKRHVTAKMIFKFDDFETVIDNLNIEFLSKRPDGVVGARFTDLNPQQISILNQIISAYLAGDIVTEDDIIHAVTRAKFTEKKETKTKIDKKKSIFVLLILWLFILFLILFLMYVMYQRTYIVKSENAYFDANMTIIRAPSPSYIEFAKNFKPNEEINKSEMLMFAHLMYGGVQSVKSPLKGKIYKILIHNGDFRNVGEPVFSILDNNYKIYLVASILHKDLVKIHIGDIAKVSLPDGDKFYAKIVKVKFPYEVVEQHARPLENIYNQARNYDKVILYPIDYNVSDKLIGTSAVVTVDTLLNKYKWYSISENSKTDKTKNTKEKNSTKTEKNELTPKSTDTQQTAAENIKSDTNISNITKNRKEINKTNIVSVQQPEKHSNKKTLKTKTVVVNKYCIIAASSSKPFKDRKSLEFLHKFSNAKVEKVGNLYELKLSYFDSYKSALNYINKKVNTYYKSAFIIKCKVRKND